MAKLYVYVKQDRIIIINRGAKYPVTQEEAGLSQFVALSLKHGDLEFQSTTSWCTSWLILITPRMSLMIQDILPYSFAMIFSLAS